MSRGRMNSTGSSVPVPGFSPRLPPNSLIRSFGDRERLSPPAELNAPITVENQRGRVIDEAQSEASFINDMDQSVFGDQMDSVLTEPETDVDSPRPVARGSVAQSEDVPELANLGSDTISEN